MSSAARANALFFFKILDVWRAPHALDVEYSVDVDEEESYSYDAQGACDCDDGLEE